MRNLSERLEKYERNRNFDLTYSWKNGQQGEKEVNKLFSQWNRDLHEILNSNVPQNQKEKKLKTIIKNILKWGGIYRLSNKRLDHYVNKILNGNFEGKEIDKDTLLSSWTKILAAYDPEKYWIYDSRVAIALKILVSEYEWFIPRRRNDKVGAHIRNHYTNRLSEADSYNTYLVLLRAVDAQKRCSLEKKLFMLGGKITINDLKAEH